MKQALKRGILRVASKSGLFSLVLESSWRQRRLLILCYHGISLEDEHQWDGSLYLSPDRLRAGFSVLKEMGCSVLPLGEALERLKAGSLPPRSVALTFDDGFYDFHRHAMPLLREYGFPATVYLTTYYCEKERAVFDPMVSYLLWKGREEVLDWPEIAAPTALSSTDWRFGADRAIKQHAYARQFDAAQKDHLLVELADRLGVDYGRIRDKRILHLMRPEEVREAAEAGFDIQLHTHRHRVSRDRQLFDREITENRTRIEAYTGRGDIQHFCYPGGFHLKPFAAWLRGQGVVSATTCQPGLASAASDWMLLPRFVLTSQTTRDELISWISGFADLLPKRRAAMSGGQLLEGPPA